MFKTTLFILSALSMGLGVSYWDRTNVDWNLRGATSAVVVTKEDSQASSDPAVDQMMLQPQDDNDNVQHENDELQAYNLSPYEMHWPEYQLDPWMRKRVDRIPSKDNEVCLVHVGKVRH